ncbi:golgin subfamily A member 5-like isoform X2 [Hypanus sabinus]|uniref:golgin subfamily A member 5-like isoform X2 n=1 Tax=Hypanus sabinus TaxID=79690 RepID=UPI0028C4E380|nr:golgin subfamily A member 5-like isoform X2 [Hypanus sabinus]
MNIDISLLSQEVTDDNGDTMMLKFGSCHQKDTTFNEIQCLTGTHSGSPPDIKHLIEELEIIKFQIEIQTKTIESLNQTGSLLAKGIVNHQQRIKQLEEEVRKLNMSSNIEEDRISLMIDKRIEHLTELSSNLAKPQQSSQQAENQVQSTDTANQAENPATEMHESKSFLWEEYESLRNEIEKINRKLSVQEDDLVSSLTDCKILKQNQKNYDQILESLIQRCSQLQPPDTEQEIRDIKQAIVEMQEQIRNPCSCSSRSETIDKRGSNTVLKQLMEENCSASDSDSDTW